MRILIADGDKDQWDLYLEWLEGEGHEIFFASSFAEAQETIAHVEQLDVGILDCCFQQRHLRDEGDALAVRLQDRFPDIKIVWVGIIERKGTFHVSKPFGRERFLNALRALKT